MQKKRTCISVIAEDLQMFEALCKKRLSTVSRELNLLIQQELQRQMLEDYNNVDS